MVHPQKNQFYYKMTIIYQQHRTEREGSVNVLSFIICRKMLSQPYCIIIVVVVWTIVVYYFLKYTKNVFVMGLLLFTEAQRKLLGYTSPCNVGLLLLKIMSGLEPSRKIAYQLVSMTGNSLIIAKATRIYLTD